MTTIHNEIPTGCGTIFPIGKTWYFECRGRKIKKHTLKTTDRNEALGRAWLEHGHLFSRADHEEILKRQWDHTKQLSTKVIPGSTPMEHLLTKWQECCKHYRKNYSLKTTQQYTKKINQFSTWCLARKLNSLNEVDTVHCKEFLAQYEGHSYQNYQLASLTSIIGLICEKDEVPNPFAKVVKIPIEEAAKTSDVREPFTQDEIFDIHTYSRCMWDEKTTTLMVGFMWVAVNMGIECAFRIGDIIHMRKSSIIDDTHISIIEGKTGKPRIRTAPNSIKAIRGYLDRFPVPEDEDFVFPHRVKVYEKRDACEENTYFRRMLATLGIDSVGNNKHSPKLSYHSYRHTFASQLHLAGYSDAQIQEFMGHSSPSTTNRYIAATARSQVRLVKANEYSDALVKSDGYYNTVVDPKTKADPITNFVKNNQAFFNSLTEADLCQLVSLIQPKK
jgi:integrase